ncbi:MAG: hypothetical protein IKS18_05605 [Lachnospiraceae bacterium]|nr:hypothetical protein [Lachnospiraceae bacterium]
MSSEKKSNKPLLIILLVLAVLGLAAEFVFKFIYVNTMVDKTMDRVFQITMRQVAQGFLTESQPIYAFWTMKVPIMRLMPGSPFMGYLRWLPYLVLLAVPVLCVFMKKRGILLLVSGVFSLVEGILMSIVILSMNQPMYNLVQVFPFLIEGVLVLLLAISLLSGKRGFVILMGIVCILFAIDSPVITAVFSGMNATFFRNGAGQVFSSYLFTRLRNMHYSLAVSSWPVYKFFVFVMYGVLAFFTAGSLKKKAEE